MADEPFHRREGKELPAELAPFVPKGHEAFDFATGDLDRDGRADAVLVLRKPDEAEREDWTPRPLLLLVRQADGRLKLARRSDRLVYCYRCGGMMGDPYQGVTVETGRVKVTHYGGSAWRWGNSYTFAYDSAKEDWLLDEEWSTSFHATAPGEGSEVTITRGELGDVPIGSFDYEGDDEEKSKKWRVVAERARFYDQPDLGSAPRRAFVVRGDVVDGYRELKNFVRASFTNSKGDTTQGFLLKKDLAPLASPPSR